MLKPLVVASAFALSLVACSQEKTTETATTAPAAPEATAPAPGVERAETPPAAATPSAPAAAAPLSTQAGPSGTQISLTKARVVGDILNIELQFAIPPATTTAVYTHAEIDQINYIDDATSRKYNVLKDQQGQYMALPLNSNGKILDITVRKAQPAIVTLKFPAPPATSPTVSLSIPGASSFDAIPVQR